MCVCACVYVVYMYMRVFDNTYMSSARTRVTRVRASVRIQRMVKMRELAREVRDSERTDERRPPPPAHRPSATQPILCHLKQKARFPLLVFTSALSSPPLPSSPPLLPSPSRNECQRVQTKPTLGIYFQAVPTLLLREFENTM